MSILRFGIAKELEEAANELIRVSLIGVTSYEAKSDVLTPWKEAMRRDREVYVTDGTPDAAIRKGMYHRAYNSASPHLNSQDCIARGGRSTAMRSLQEHVDRYRGGSDSSGDRSE